MGEEIIGAGLGGFIDFLGSIFTNQQNMQMAREAQAFQKQEAELAYKRDVDFWNMQNQYNSPEAQRQRLEDAGMNPMLAFGNGIKATTGNTTSAPQYNPSDAVVPHLQPYNITTSGQLANIIHQKLLLDQQMKFQDAQIGEIKARTLNELQKLEHDNELHPYLLEAKRETARQISLANDNLSFKNSIQSEEWELDKQLRKMEINQKDLSNQLAQFNLDFNKDAREIRLASEVLDNQLKQANILVSKETMNNLIARTALYYEELSNAFTQGAILETTAMYEHDLYEQRKKNFSFMTDQEFTKFIQECVGIGVQAFPKIANTAIRAVATGLIK